MASQAEIDAFRNSVRAAQVYGKGQYIEDGQHLLEVDKLLCKQTSTEGTFKETWIIEFKVVQSTNPSHEVGQTRSYVEATKNQGWLSRFKSCVAACCGADPNKLSEQDQKTIDDVMACAKYAEERVKLGWPEQVLARRRVICEGFQGKSKSGGTVTNKRWEPAPQAPAPAAAQ